MEWNGMEWNGMEWNGMEWNGMEYFWSERSYNDHLVQLPDHFTADQKLKLVTKGIVQMRLND